MIRRYELDLSSTSRHITLGVLRQLITETAGMPASAELHVNKAPQFDALTVEHDDGADE